MEIMPEEFTIKQTGQIAPEISATAVADAIYAQSLRYLHELAGLGVRRTELVPLDVHPLAEAGYGLQVKNESEQPTGAYKLRGAARANVHSQQDIPESVVKTARFADGLSRQAFIDPLDSIGAMAGPASVAHEMLDDLLMQQDRGEIDLQHDEIIVTLPDGGGGLSAAFAVVFRHAREAGTVGANVRIVVVQMERCDAIARLANGGEPLTSETLDDTCDETAVLVPGKLTMGIIADRNFVEEVITVPKNLVAKTMAYLAELHGTEVEPAGALSMAGAMYLGQRQGPTPDDGKRHIFLTVTSGSNISPEAFSNFLFDAMTPEERQAAVRILPNPELIFPEVTYRVARSAGHITTKRSAGPVRVGTSRVWSSPTTRSYTPSPRSEVPSR